ncbi:MAG: hypothetical protein WCK96_00745 [Methylococcales bacterium]
MKKILFTFIALGLLVSCSSTSIVSSWKEPSTTLSSNQIHKILFIALLKDESYRRQAEDKLVSLSKGKGIASYAYMSSDSTKADLEQRVKADAIDLVVIMRLADVQKETRYVPGSSDMYGYNGMYGYGGYMGGYRYAAPMYYDPGYYTTDKKYLVETNVYSVDPNKLLWAGTTSTMNPTEIDTTTTEIVNAVVDNMKKEGFLLK